MIPLGVCVTSWSRHVKISHENNTNLKESTLNNVLNCNLTCIQIAVSTARGIDASA